MPYKLPSPEAKPPSLTATNVPEQFWHLIPLAEKYGISDDSYREELIRSLDITELKECASFLGSYDQVLDQWLAGPVAASSKPSDEYVAFSALGMAAEAAKHELERRT